MLLYMFVHENLVIKQFHYILSERFVQVKTILVKFYVQTSKVKTKSAGAFVF